MYKQKGDRAVNRKHSGKEELRPIYVDLVYTIRSSPRLGPEVRPLRTQTANPIIGYYPLHIVSGRCKVHVSIGSGLTVVGPERDELITEL